MRSPLTVAVAQCASRPGDVAENLARHRHFIAGAKAAGADMLVFPELSLVGHTGAEALLDVAMPSRDPRLVALSREAGEMTLVVGFVEEGPSAQFYNTSAVYRGGALVHLHRKINLPSYGRLVETKYYAAGRFVDVHRMGGEGAGANGGDWIMGRLICADLYNPALAHLSVLHGATMLVAPVSSAREAVGDAFDNPGSWATTVRFYAMMYGAPVVMANRVGNEGELSFWGGSRILDPHGRILAEAGEEEALIHATLDYDEVRAARASLPTVRDSNLALVHRETTRLIETLGVPSVVRDEG
ncbi:nitrilase-related carbon-nitrogen hydrolase [Rhodovulum sp. DZ06]|uniref:nitrilase-related carbon-nitrogen hydrolase n=1 Tax=Rhodovulum sp. DZ06 TaxID=3425126 RepID=UPI003D350B1D